ncbi:MAG: hypothetical protein ACTSSK_05670 [Candidatus Heimdallarchaeota archaeon]
MENSESLKTDILTEEFKKARFTFLLTLFLAMIVFVGVFYLALVLPLSTSNLFEVIATHSLGLTYKILVFVCLSFWLIAMIFAFVIPLFNLRIDNHISTIISLNNERIKPTSTKNKAKKFFIDILAVTGFVLFIISQVILYAFIYF